jgi:hypothetical protein
VSQKERVVIMAAKRTGKNTGFVDKVSSGLFKSDPAEEDSCTTSLLMSRYHDLVETGLIDVSGVFDPPCDTRDDPSERKRRRSSRICPPIGLRVHEVTRPEIKGIVNDITESGIGIRLIGSRLDEINTFIIPANQVSGVESVAFTTICRWTAIIGDGGVHRSGHEIIRITDYNLRELRKLVASVTCSEPQSPSSGT